MGDLSWVNLTKQVYQRANFRCEYCQTPQLALGQSMHVEHIQPLLGDTLDNLCLACPSCNLSKGKVTSAIDPLTQEIVSLFNPRNQNWHQHFKWSQDGSEIVGLTTTGRATIIRLRMNSLRLVEARKIWILADIHPPS